MASMRNIKRRKGSIQSTQQITKAMKLVSTVKLQRARARTEQSKAYFTCMYETVTSLLKRAGNIDHPYLQKNGSDKKAVVVITSNRGLAGGYNSNIVKLITQGKFEKEKTFVYAIGKKGKDTLARRGYSVRADYSDSIEEPKMMDAIRLSNDLLQAYEKGEIGEIYIAYTAFKNTVSHIPTLIKVLPAEAEEEVLEAGHKSDSYMNFETTEEEAINLIIPKYVSSLIFGGMVEAVASENGARMQAMDSATGNAEEMIEELSLLYNRARQGSITQELTEIIAGAEAIG